MSYDSVLVVGWEIDKEKLCQWAIDNKVGSCFADGIPEDVSKQCPCCWDCWSYEHIDGDVPNFKRYFIADNCGNIAEDRFFLALETYSWYGTCSIDKLQEHLSDPRLQQYSELAGTLGASHKEPIVYAASWAS